MGHLLASLKPAAIHHTHACREREGKREMEGGRDSERGERESLRDQEIEDGHTIRVYVLSLT